MNYILLKILLYWIGLGIVVGTALWFFLNVAKVCEYIADRLFR
jgi:hypothetical protein